MAVSVRTLTYVLPLHQPPPAFRIVVVLLFRFLRARLPTTGLSHLRRSADPRSASNLVSETFSLFRPPNHPLCHSPRLSFFSCPSRSSGSSRFSSLLAVDRRLNVIADRALRTYHRMLRDSIELYVLVRVVCRSVHLNPRFYVRLYGVLDK